MQETGNMGGGKGRHRFQVEKETHMQLSARNQLKAKVVSVTEGAVTTVVELDVGGQRLVSSVTAEPLESWACAREWT